MSSQDKKDGELRDSRGEVLSVISEDYQNLAEIRTRDISQVWDEDFLEFSKWLRKDFHSRYSRQDFRDIQFRATIDLMIALVSMISCYAYLRLYYLSYLKFWFAPFFVVSLWAIRKEEVVHMRSHWPSKMTGFEAFDKGIDYTMMILTGASKETFRRRHVAAHYCDIANLSRVFSDVWVPFVTLPAIYYLRPFLILKFILDKEFLKREKMDRTQLIIEAFGLYSYIGIMFAELYHGSFFLICFHLCPLLIFHGSQILGATLSHSGIDKRNSFNSNGLFDPETAPGLFRVSLTVVNLISGGGVINHGIHHGYSQAPLEIINREYRRINKYCLDTFKDVRYNDVLAMRVQENIYSSFPAPNIFNYFIQTCVALLILFFSVLTVIGMDIPPVFFEPYLVDYRIFFAPKAQKYANICAMWDSIHMMDRHKRVSNPNAYLQFAANAYKFYKEYLRTHPNEKWVEPKIKEIAPSAVLIANGHVKHD